MSLPKSNNAEYKAEIVQTRSFLRFYADQVQCLKLEKEYLGNLNTSNHEEKKAMDSENLHKHSDATLKNQTSFYPLCMATMDYFRRVSSFSSVGSNDLASLDSSSLQKPLLWISKSNDEEYYDQRNGQKIKQASISEYNFSSSSSLNSNMIHFNQFHFNSFSENNSLQQNMQQLSDTSSSLMEQQIEQQEQYMNQVRRSRIRDVMPQFLNRLREWKAANHGAYKDVESQDETTKMFDIFLADVQHRLANCLSNKKNKWQQVLEMHHSAKDLQMNGNVTMNHELMAKFAFAHCGASYHELLFKGIMMSCEKSLKFCLEKHNLRENLENEKVGHMFDCSEELLNSSAECSKFAKQRIFDLMKTHLKY
ncbi:hypothetical protein FDP41_008326 [Naegleria fowleri]|uniref:Uncharacterized protein n=1 Tax=Naegleria fowleri TaxID=5763 RepID=A0A6A5BFN5_NAEFO|nr:uncharacterized protein FDP41_008326 [Naegleria fowleri]KAF0973622.1 hypothetical protein FDP41_008326 [Naegleria fowleri]CAG4710435.1 unnamed protein product [Naegleria fowleri]